MIFCIGVLMFVSGVQHTFSLSLDCAKSDDGTTLTATFREVSGGTVNLLEGFNGADGATDKCFSTLITSGGTSAHELSITVSLETGMQIAPTIGSSNCYVAAPTAPSTLYTFNVVARKSTVMIKLDDTVHEGTCDSTIDSSQEELTGGVPVANILVSTPVTAMSDGVAASLVDNAGAALTALDLGDTSKLRISFTVPTVPTGLVDGEYPQALQIYDVELSGYSDFRTTYNLYTSNGCINETAEAELNVDAGITYNAVDSTLGTTHIFDTGMFEAAMFDGPVPKKMYIRFSYKKSCLSVTDEKCADHEAYCTNNALTRKKRSADNMLITDQQFNPIIRMKRNTPISGNNGTLSFGVPINVHTKGATSSQGGSENRGNSSAIKAEECEIPDMYWIIALVLGVLLLFMMALCVFLVLRLRKQQNHNQHFAEKLGHQNSGYRY